MAANVGGAKIVVDVNAFTDAANSAGAFAQYALTNHIQAAAWELCNEGYLLTGAGNFFTNGADYAAKMGTLLLVAKPPGTQPSESDSTIRQAHAAVGRWRGQFHECGLSSGSAPALPRAGVARSVGRGNSG